MKETERWADIEEYQGYYKVSTWGRVKSVERTARIGRGYRTVSERILKPQVNENGYMLVTLYKNNIKKTYSVHQLVASAFCENPYGYKEVNHIDQNKENNRADNLEFCSRQYNVEYSQAKAVIGIDKITGLIVEFPSSHEASRVLGINQSHITQCCKGKLKSIGGFNWFYSSQDTTTIDNTATTDNKDC